MDFVVQWLWYLLAFAAGSAVAWLVTVLCVRHTSSEAALAELSGSGQDGAR